MKKKKISDAVKKAIAYRKWKMCGSKVDYVSRKNARHFLSRNPEPRKFRIYQCDVCFLWHISTKKDKK